MHPPESDCCRSNLVDNNSNYWAGASHAASIHYWRSSAHQDILARELVFDVCQAIRSDAVNAPVAGSRVPGTYRCVHSVPMLLRLNLPQALPATMARVSRSTASRVVSARTPVKATGLDIQVACTLTGRLARVSDPLPGRLHDTAATRASGLLDVPDRDLPPGAGATRRIADGGCIGLGMITPGRKPLGRPLPKADKERNRSVVKIRYTIERTIANLRTWRTLHTDCRRFSHTLKDALTAVLGITFTHTA